jgi:hypothetical protein
MAQLKARLSYQPKRSIEIECYAMRKALDKHYQASTDGL